MPVISATWEAEARELLEPGGRSCRRWRGKSGSRTSGEEPPYQHVLITPGHVLSRASAGKWPSPTCLNSDTESFWRPCEVTLWRLLGKVSALQNPQFGYSFDAGDNDLFLLICLLKIVTNLVKMGFHHVGQSGLEFDPGSG